MGLRNYSIGRLIALAGALIVLALLALIGVIDISHSFAVFALFVIVEMLVNQRRSPAPDAWPPPPLRVRGGARSELAHLAWATTTHTGAVSERVLARVRAVAARVLAAQGVAWSGQPGSPMSPPGLAGQLLGAAAVQTLTTTGEVRPRALARTVAQLEQVAKLPPHTHQTTQLKEQL